MRILSYLQARERLGEGVNEELIKKVLTVCGRAEEWIGRTLKVVKKNPLLSETEIVEATGMGRAILTLIPREEWVYLVNPSLAQPRMKVCQENVVIQGRIFALAFASWLAAQEYGLIYLLSTNEFTVEEGRMVRLFWQKQEGIVDREELAEAMWSSNWTDKYSDWGIDAAVSRIRKKLSGNWQIVTVKGRGYMLATTAKPTKAPQLALKRDNRVREIPASIYPTDEYLTYMNDPTRVRKVYKDLFNAIKAEGIEIPLGENPLIIAVNSYSYDNVDAVNSYISKEQAGKVCFVHYDPRAIEMHLERIRELGLNHRCEAFHDDLRESKIKSESADLVINDFRLNFNQADMQNKKMMEHTYRILKSGGSALVSTVVDGKYENQRYGEDQEKAPVNAGRPGTFQADEHLVRRCWSVPYYRQLFEKAGFATIHEFDIEEGRRWGAQPTISTNPWQGPYYRRWKLTK